MPRSALARRLAALPLLSLAAAWPAAARAQAVTLRVSPRVGDTLHTRLEQLTEVTASSNGRSSRKMTTAVTLSSRTIVREALPASTVVLTIVDSAQIRTSDEHAAAQAAAAERQLRGQQMVIRLASDGTVESARDPRVGALAADVARSMAAMPAVFPKKAVSAGDQWMREMPLPAGGAAGARGSAHVIAAFRLDSLGRGGEVAYLSMQGDIRPDSTSHGIETTGEVSGTMQVDRVRGWMTDSRVTILVRSVLTPPDVASISPLHLLTRVTQRLRTMDKR